MSDKLFTVSGPTGTLPDWDEMANLLGPNRVRAIDRAVSEFLGNRSKHGPIPRDEMYLVSEGVAYAVCLALLEHE